MRAAQGNDCVEMIHCVNSTLDLTWVAFPLVMVFVGLTGCASGGPSNPFTGGRPVGSVFGGQTPVSRRLNQLYAVGSTGDRKSTRLNSSRKKGAIPICASGGPSNPFTGGRPVGSVFGGQTPVSGSLIQLYAVGST